MAPSPNEKAEWARSSTNGISIPPPGQEPAIVGPIAIEEHQHPVIPDTLEVVPLVAPFAEPTGLAIRSEARQERITPRSVEVADRDGLPSARRGAHLDRQGRSDELDRE